MANPMDEEADRLVALFPPSSKARGVGEYLALGAR